MDKTDQLFEYIRKSKELLEWFAAGVHIRYRAEEER